VNQVFATVSSNFAPVIWSEACARQLDKMFRLRLAVPILCITEEMERAAWVRSGIIEVGAYAVTTPKNAIVTTNPNATRSIFMSCRENLKKGRPLMSESFMAVDKQGCSNPNP
jgi:hypothetical protein